MKRIIILAAFSVLSGSLFCATPINLTVYTERQFDIAKDGEKEAFKQYGKGMASKLDQEGTMSVGMEGSFTKEEMLTLPFADLLKQIWGLIS